MIFVFLSSFLCVRGKYVEGELNTQTDWEFITRFCFLSDKGSLRFTFEYPVDYAPENVLLYFDTPEQWDSVYKTDKTCDEKVAVMNPANNQIIYLDLPYSGCEQITVDGVDMVSCSGMREFRSARERWWFIAVSRCSPTRGPPNGLRLKYKIHMTNGEEGDYLHREYSADEFYILPINIVFLILYAILSALIVVCAVQLHKRQLLHTTYKLYMVSVFFTTFSLFLLSIGYGIYGNDGLGDKLLGTKYAGRAFEALSVIIFLLMLILMGKGYTITRGKLTTISTIKITVFFTIYVVAYVVLFVWEGIFFDPGLVLYVYESPPGYGLIGMRLIGWIWFCYAIFFTLKHYPEKGRFYYPFFVFYTLWFWAGPIVIVVAMYAIALWSREKTVVGVENFVSLCGHIFFLVLTRPAAANSNFPYHVRTTQIGIITDAPHTNQNGLQDDGDLGGHAYSISSPTPSSSNGPDLTGLFVTSKTRSDRRSPEPSLNNNEPKGELPPSYSAVEHPDTETVLNTQPMQPTAPPRYDVLFQVNGGYTGDHTS